MSDSDRGMRAGSRAVVALGIAYALYAIRLLWLYRQTSVHGDFWFMYDHLFSMPFPANVLTPENAHSMVVPKLIWLANMGLFRGNETSLYLFTLLLLVILAALFVRLAATDRGEKALLLVSSLLATFWIAKADILISAGYAMTCSLPMIGLLLMVLAVMRPGQPEGAAPAWGLGLCGGILASFSFGTGLAVWPVALVLIWWRNGRWREVAAVLAGMAAAVFLVLVIFPQWLPDSAQPRPTISIGENIKYWLMLIGSPIGNTWAGMSGTKDVDEAVALAAGCLGGLSGAVLTFRAWRRRKMLGLSEWTGLALMLFAGGAAALIALGRTSFFRWFQQDPFSSRYLFWSAFFWLGLLWICPKGRIGIRRDAFCVSLAAVCLLLVWPAHVRMTKRYSDDRAENEYIVAKLVAGVPRRNTGQFLNFSKYMVNLDGVLREKRLCYYTRPAYAAFGESLATSFEVRTEREQAVFDPVKTYATDDPAGKAVAVSGWVLGEIGDSILLTDEQQIIRGVGVFAGNWQPFSSSQRNHFMAFAPALPGGQRYGIWSVRGRECRAVAAAK